MESYIKQGDCLDLMQEIPEQSIDMVLCDLPYGLTPPLPDALSQADCNGVLPQKGLPTPGHFKVNKAASRLV